MLGVKLRVIGGSQDDGWLFSNCYCFGCYGSDSGKYGVYGFYFWFYFGFDNLFLFWVQGGFVCKVQGLVVFKKFIV